MSGGWRRQDVCVADLTRALARLRVPLGFASALAVLWLATPTSTLLIWGGLVASFGEGLRVWAAGHLIKSREVTSSGPYRFFAHPLYVGSSVMGVGLALASGSAVVAAVVAIYLGVTITAAIKSEEAFLRQKFGENYDAYRRGGRRTGAAQADASRPFSLSLAVANREYRALVGLVVAVLLLLLKAKI